MRVGFLDYSFRESFADPRGVSLRISCAGKARKGKFSIKGAITVT
jgi:hypothetical protein